MKIRTDFVTNSSSSSFILAFKDKDDAINTVNKLSISDNAKRLLLRDIKNTTSMTSQELDTYLNEECEDVIYYYLTYGNGNNSFENKWLKKHSGLSWLDMRNDPEYIAELERLTQEYKQKILSKINIDNKFIISVEYGDSTCVGSELEYSILPNMPNMIQQFSHH